MDRQVDRLGLLLAFSVRDAQLGEFCASIFAECGTVEE